MKFEGGKTMKLKYLISIVLIIPIIGLFFANNFEVGLSISQIDTINFVCITVLLIAALDLLFIAFKRRRT